MCDPATLTAAGAAIASAASTAATAVSSFLGTALITAGETTLLTVGGALSAVATASTAALAYKSSRASAKAQQAQMDAIQQLQEADTGKLEVNKTADGLKDSSNTDRPLSSLRVSLVPQQQQADEITKNVYGVDTNTVATATQNMTGLNIAL